MFQGPISEESLTTAVAATEVALSTFEEEEASGVPTDGLVPLTPTVPSEQVVPSVSVSERLLRLTAGSEVRVMTGAVTGLPRGKCTLSLVRAHVWVGPDWRDAGCKGRSVTGPRESGFCPEPATSQLCPGRAVSESCPKSEGVAGGGGYQGDSCFRRGCASLCFPECLGGNDSCG